MVDDDRIDFHQDTGLGPTEQLEYNQVVHRRAIPAQTVPLFALLLAGVSLFMAVLMFGSGNWLGGGVFSLIVIPLAIYLGGIVRRRVHGLTAQEQRDKATGVGRSSWDDIDERGSGF